MMEQRARDNRQDRLVPISDSLDTWASSPNLAEIMGLNDEGNARAFAQGWRAGERFDRAIEAFSAVLSAPDSNPIDDFNVGPNHGGHQQANRTARQNEEGQYDGIKSFASGICGILLVVIIVPVLLLLSLLGIGSGILRMIMDLIWYMITGLKDAAHAAHRYFFKPKKVSIV